MAEDSEVRLTLRLPAVVRDKLLGLAKESGRSLNAEIVSRLERSITFEDDYGPLEDVIMEIWNDLERLKATVEDHDRHLNPMKYEWET